MCKSLDEGGLRCDSHNRQKLEAANGVLTRTLVKEAGLSGVNAADKRYNLIPFNKSFVDNDEAQEIIDLKLSIERLPKYAHYGTLLKIDESIDFQDFLDHTLLSTVRDSYIQKNDINRANNLRNLQDDLISREVYLEREKNYDERLVAFDEGVSNIRPYLEAQSEIIKLSSSNEEENNIVSALNPVTSMNYNPYYEKYLTRKRMQASTEEETQEIDTKIELFNNAKEKFNIIDKKFLEAYADEELDNLNFILMSSNSQLLDNKKKNLGAEYLKVVANEEQSEWTHIFRENPEIIELSQSEEFKNSPAYSKWIEAEKDFNFFRLISPSNLKIIENRIDAILGIQERERLSNNLHKLKVRQLTFKIKNMKEALSKAKSDEDREKIKRRININVDKLKNIQEENKQ